jgi:hypothetical protein
MKPMTHWKSLKRGYKMENLFILIIEMVIIVGMVLLWHFLSCIVAPKKEISMDSLVRKKKYILYPGEVASKFDGDRHYIDAYRLAQLYKVRIDECFIADSRNVVPSNYFAWNGTIGFDHRNALIKLYPRYDGDYKIPEN